MVNVLISNKNTDESQMNCKEINYDRNYNIQTVNNGIDTISTYWKKAPDILVLDNNIQDMLIEDIINRLSADPMEQKKCNTILTLDSNYHLNLKKFTKIDQVITKPIKDNELSNAIKELAIDYNTPDLKFGEVDTLLQLLNFNCISPGYTYLKDAIIYCYYKPNQLEFLNTIIEHIAYEHKVSKIKVRDSLYNSLQPFKSLDLSRFPNEIKLIFFDNSDITLKKFLEKLVFYLIKSKREGKIF